MKSLVIYYSHSGNTTYVMQKLHEALPNKEQAESFRLQYKGGTKSLITRLFYRINPSLVKLEPVPFDIKDYNLLCLGIPVLGAHPSAAILKYITTCKNIDKKKIICCYIYGLEASAKICARKIEGILQKKGQPNIINMYVPWMDIHKEQFLDKTISNALAEL
jgi:hypothetical protein